MSSSKKAGKVDEDEAAFSRAHGPAALWANYLASRRKSSPLFVDQRQKSKAVNAMSARYLSLRIHFQEVRSKLGLTLFEKRSEGSLVALESSRFFLASNIGQDVRFGIDISPHLVNDSLMIGFQVIEGEEIQSCLKDQKLQARPMTREDAIRLWPVSFFTKNKTKHKVKHAALLELDEVVNTKVLSRKEPFEDKPTASGGDFGRLLLAPVVDKTTHTKKKSISVKVNARLDLLPPTSHHGILKDETVPYVFSTKTKKKQKEDDNSIAVEEEKTCFRDLSHHEPKSVVYHLLYHNQHKKIHARVQVVDGLRCPWCEHSTTSARLLVFHLVSHHSPSLAFEAALKHEDMHILAAPRELQALQSLEKNNENEIDNDDEDSLALRWIYTNSNDRERLLPEIPRLDNDDQSEVFEKTDFGPSDLLKKLADAVRPPIIPRDQDVRQTHKKTLSPVYPPVRQYYHSRTGAPMTMAEAMDPDCDSDNEIDESWRLDKADRLLDEFEDVTHDEKIFMKLWNRFVHAHPIQADRRVPIACLAFAIEHAAALAPLRHNFLLHLFHLWDTSLVNAEHIAACLAVVDDPMALSTQLNGNSEFRTEDPLYTAKTHTPPSPFETNAPVEHNSTAFSSLPYTDTSSNNKRRRPSFEAGDTLPLNTSPTPTSNGAPPPSPLLTVTNESAPLAPESCPLAVHSISSDEGTTTEKTKKRKEAPPLPPQEIERPWSSYTGL